MPWWRPALQLIDSTLRGWSDSAQKAVKGIRLGRNLMAALIAAIYVLLVAAFVWPQYDRYFLAGGIFILTLSMWVWLIIISLPLQAKSVVRLIDAGYPANARELAIRAAARKMHEESIETEELLVATAWNEGRKAVEKYRARARVMKEEMDTQPEPGNDSADDSAESSAGKS